MTAETLASGMSTTGRQMATKSKQDLAEAGRQKLEAFRNKKKTVNNPSSEQVSKRDSPAKVLKSKLKATHTEKTYGAADEARSQNPEGRIDLRSSAQPPLSTPLPADTKDDPVPIPVPRPLPTPVPTSVPTPVPTPVLTSVPKPVLSPVLKPVPPPLPPPVPTPVPSSLLTPVPTRVPTAVPTPKPTSIFSELFAAAPQLPSPPKQTPFFLSQLSEFPRKQSPPIPTPNPHPTPSPSPIPLSPLGPRQNSRPAVPESLNPLQDFKMKSVSSVLPEWQPTKKTNFSSFPPTLKFHPPTAHLNGATLSEDRDARNAGAASDFLSLEQHIDSLTVEKFSLQRSVECAKTLADALVEENGSLMEAFNQQGTVMAGLRQELQERQGEVDSLQALATGALEERDRAVEEGRGAQERSQALAKEVIALEEKVLQLRSSELKLGAALNNVRGEKENHKQMFASVEREQAHTKQQLSGLYDEKRVLQFRLRRLSLGGALMDVRGSSFSKGEMPLYMDATTSTMDLESETEVQSRAASQPQPTPSPNPLETSTGPQPLSPPHTPTTPTIPTIPTIPTPTTETTETTETAETTTSDPPIPPHEEGQVSTNDTCPPSSASLERVTAVIADAMAVARNNFSSVPLPHQLSEGPHPSIDRLLNEILLEKESLLRNLASREAAIAELQVSHSDLSNRLSLQTQRLELVCAQSMREPPSPLVQSRSLTEREYRNESDEVAERMLSWLLRLLPGGRVK